MRLFLAMAVTAGLTFFATNLWARHDVQNGFAELARVECPHLIMESDRPDTQFLRVRENAYVPVYKPARMITPRPTAPANSR